MDKSGHNITGLLRAFQGGDSAALDRLLPLVYDELRKIAGGQVRSDHRTPLQPTELVHEAFLKLRASEGMAFSDRSHFFAVACQSMRWILRDLARGQMRDKRGGTSVRVSFEEAHHGSASPMEIDCAQLNDLFQTFESQDARASQVAQLRVLMGLEISEIATALSISESTVKRDWQMASAWFLRELGLNRNQTKRASSR